MTVAIRGICALRRTSEHTHGQWPHIVAGKGRTRNSLAYGVRPGTWYPALKPEAHTGGPRRFMDVGLAFLHQATTEPYFNLTRRDYPGNEGLSKREAYNFLPHGDGLGISSSGQPIDI